MMENSIKLHLDRGLPMPYGATTQQEGVNFALFCPKATALSLCLFRANQKEPFIELPFDPKLNKSGEVWHLLVHHLPDDCSYGYRLDGPQSAGFDPTRILVDPFSKSIDASTPGITTGKVNPTIPFDWEEDVHPNIPENELIIYEMHVKGFAKNFHGVREKIPYLKNLGINAVELLPIASFDPNIPFTSPKNDVKLTNYWGYNTINFFSLMSSYGSIFEFKRLVKALHQAGIEVILDVVFNHTAEGGNGGPLYSFKGIARDIYYMTNESGDFLNYSGCGNTFNCNHTVTCDLIRQTLVYFVQELHVDGFRFDLASTLTRGAGGEPLSSPLLIETLSNDPLLAKRKLIAEPWDPGGLYQVGSFPGGHRWMEWNAQYRDTIRRFIKGSDGEVGNFARRVCGSEDLYGNGRFPTNSINFITCHDGFSLNDLVSYNDKHNEDNGEQNRDGERNNESWNCGYEGPIDDPDVLHLRERQKRNFFLALMISQGVPMISMGDEYGHTKGGNNNSWCHDTPLNWFDWDQSKSPLRDFLAFLIDLRKRTPSLRRSRFLQREDIRWHGIEPDQPDWSASSRFIAFSLKEDAHDETLYLAFNANFHPVEIKLPPGRWAKIIDTSHFPYLYDEKEPRIEAQYPLESYASLLLKNNELT